MDTTALQSISGSLGGISYDGSTDNSLGKEDFLKLLVAQLAHQDPLQPMENSEFVAQLSQFSSLEQLMSVNTNLSLIQVGQASMTNSQVAGLIGREVEAKGDILRHVQEGPEAINFNLSATAAEVTINIRDGQGNLVRRIEAGGRTPGLNTITWDGKDTVGTLMPAGQYSIEVSAKDQSGGKVEASTSFKGIVSGISYDGGIPLLELGNTTIRVGDVIAIRIPTNTNNAATGQ